MAKKAVVQTPVKAKELATDKPPKSTGFTQKEWDAISPAGKVYHVRKSQGLCVRCGKKAIAKKNGEPSLMCQEHTDYIRSFSKKDGAVEEVKGSSTGKKSKVQVDKTPVRTSGKTKSTKAYKQLGVKQLKDLNAEDEAAAAEA